MSSFVSGFVLFLSVLFDNILVGLFLFLSPGRPGPSPPLRLWHFVLSRRQIKIYLLFKIDFSPRPRPASFRFVFCLWFSVDDFFVPVLFNDPKSILLLLQAVVWVEPSRHTGCGNTVKHEETQRRDRRIKVLERSPAVLNQIEVPSTSRINPSATRFVHS